MTPLSIIEMMVKTEQVGRFEPLLDDDDLKHVKRLRDRQIAWVVDAEAWRLSRFSEKDSEYPQWGLERFVDRKWRQVAIVNEECYLAFEALWPGWDVPNSKQLAVFQGNNSIEWAK